jgi:hypothetical protein
MKNTNRADNFSRLSQSGRLVESGVLSISAMTVAGK